MTTPAPAPGDAGACSTWTASTSGAFDADDAADSGVSTASTAGADTPPEVAAEPRRWESTWLERSAVRARRLPVGLKRRRRCELHQSQVFPLRRLTEAEKTRGAAARGGLACLRLGTVQHRRGSDVDLGHVHAATGVVPVTKLEFHSWTLGVGVRPKRQRVDDGRAVLVVDDL